MSTSVPALARAVRAPAEDAKAAARLAKHLARDLTLAGLANGTSITSRELELTYTIPNEEPNDSIHDRIRKSLITCQVGRHKTNLVLGELQLPENRAVVHGLITHSEITATAFGTEAERQYLEEKGKLGQTIWEQIDDKLETFAEDANDAWDGLGGTIITGAGGDIQQGATNWFTQKVSNVTATWVGEAKKIMPKTMATVAFGGLVPDALLSYGLRQIAVGVVTAVILSGAGVVAGYWHKALTRRAQANLTRDARSQLVEKDRVQMILDLCEGKIPASPPVPAPLSLA